MKKEKVELEYVLKTTTPNILWNMVGTPFGLSEWFADDVNVKDDKYIFIWEGYEEVANLLNVKPNERIRFQWEEDEDTNFYFELKLDKHELTGDYALMITDFMEPDDKEDEILLWDKHIDDLRRKLGI